MARSERTITVDIKVQPDGQVVVYEQLEVWEGGVDSGTLVASGPRTGRVIDVGNDVTAESSLVKDIINGNLHSTSRKTARDAVKVE